ncbi:hypothetical protein C8J57DRAFT_1408070 [Mycena rebaudengoi]|nr:hypothetical protein C8J57DRAFT_1408070 [Mycena rebaudengoi]
MADDPQAPVVSDPSPVSQPIAVSLYKTCSVKVPAVPPEKNEDIDINAVVGNTVAKIGSPGHAVATTLSALWDNGLEITYTFIDAHTNQKNKVESVMKEWCTYANISFRRTESGMLRISFKQSGGSWSYVGKTSLVINKPKPTMNLGWIGKDEHISSDETSVILHEFGHVLGLLHEHQSPSRGDKLHLDEETVYAYYTQTQKWDKATVQAQIIDVYGADDVSNYSELDLSSIMMYFMPKEMNKERKEVPPNKKLSDMDKAYMVINYPRSDANSIKPWTMAHALKVAGVDTPTSSSILTLMTRTPIPAAEIREQFSRYQLRRRQEAQTVPTVQPPSGAPAEPRAGVITQPQNDVTTVPPSVAPVDEGMEILCGSSQLGSPESPKDVQHGLVAENRYWPLNTRIIYCFLGTVTLHQRMRVRWAFNLYQEHSCLTFQELDPDQVAKWDFCQRYQRDICPIRISIGPVLEGGVMGWSFRGTDNGHLFPPQNLLTWAPWTTTYIGGQPDTLENEENTPLEEREEADFALFHELGHVMGLQDEHRSPNAPLLEIGGGQPPRCEVATGWDPHSVMLWARYRYKNKRKTTKINPSPSLTDLGLLRLMYPDNGQPDGKFARALDAFGGFKSSEKAQLLMYAEQAMGQGSKREVINDLRDNIAENLKKKPRRILAKKYGIDPPSRGIAHPYMGITGEAIVATGNQVPGFLRQVVDALKEFFNPGGNQMFTLQFPGRFLDQGSFAWDTKSAGVYGQFIKSTAINESEFRLVDQLYDFADNVAGPNGSHLSMIYEELLHNLLPKFDGSNLRDHQSQIRNWLLKPVEDSEWIGDVVQRQKAREESLSTALAHRTGNKAIATTPISAVNAAHSVMFDTQSHKFAKNSQLTRLELSEVLTNEYLHAKQTWELERDLLIREATKMKLGSEESATALNDLTRELAHITATRQAQLSAKYSDAVVRGYSHSVREYMGYMDIASPGEALQDAKDALRESAMSSLDGSMKVYPIQMNPLDWFEGLSTSFTLEDLTEDVEMIRIQINSKSRQLDTLNSQLVMLTMGGKGNPKALQDEVARAQRDLEAAQSDLSRQYTSNVISMAKTCLDAAGKVNTMVLADKLGVAKTAVEHIGTDMTQVATKQDALTRASRALTQIMAGHALAEATDTQQQQQQISLQIESLTSDLNELHSRWSVLTATTGGDTIKARASSSDIPLNGQVPLQLPGDSTAGGSRWQSITLKSTAEKRKDFNSSYGDAKVEKTDCNFWLASHQSESTSSGGQASADAELFNDDIDLAFRATLVTVDRGGWFRPHLFGQSNAYYKVNKDISWSDGKPKPSGRLTGFPVGFLLAKDVIIRVIHNGVVSEIAKAAAQAQAAASGGCLCFSFSQSSSSNSTSQSKSFQSFSNGYIIKIPGPQILGYMIQKTDADVAEPMPAKLPSGFLISDEDYRGDAKKPAHAPAIPAKSPTISQDKMEELAGKLLKEKIRELFKDMSGSGESSTA